MKIAAVTDDGVSIHAISAGPPYFEVLIVDGGHITARERRGKPAYNGHQVHSAGPVQAPAMAEVIGDCQVLLARGMGEPAFHALQALGINPMLVQKHAIDKAVRVYAQGGLQHRPERIHHH